MTRRSRAAARDGFGRGRRLRVARERKRTASRTGHGWAECHAERNALPSRNGQRQRDSSQRKHTIVGGRTGDRYARTVSGESSCSRSTATHDNIPDIQGCGARIQQPGASDSRAGPRNGFGGCGRLSIAGKSKGRARRSSCLRTERDSEWNALAVGNCDRERNPA